MFKLIALALLLSTLSFAETFEILEIKGLVKIDGNTAKVKQVFTGGEVVTKKRSYAAIKIKKTGAKIIIGAESKVNLAQYKKSYYRSSIIQGFIRWISGTKKNADYQVRTPTVSIGVRGTDFYAAYDDSLDESELVLFSGLLELENQKMSDTKSVVEPGMWAGNGGRFGLKIKTMQIPRATIEKYRQKLTEKNTGADQNSASSI